MDCTRKIINKVFSFVFFQSSGIQWILYTKKKWSVEDGDVRFVVAYKESEQESIY